MEAGIYGKLKVRQFLTVKMNVKVRPVTLLMRVIYYASWTRFSKGVINNQSGLKSNKKNLNKVLEFLLRWPHTLDSCQISWHWSIHLAERLKDDSKWQIPEVIVKFQPYKPWLARGAHPRQNSSKNHLRPEPLRQTCVRKSTCWPFVLRVPAV